MVWTGWGAAWRVATTQLRVAWASTFSREVGNPDFSMTSLNLGILATNYSSKQQAG